MDNKDIIDVDPIETHQRPNGTDRVDHLRAWSFFLFFLPYCRKVKSPDFERDNWFANQGLLNLIAWAVGGLLSSGFYFAGPFWLFSIQIWNLLIAANALYGTLSFYQGKTVKMLVYGDITLIKSKI
jgi:hypothetical protein